MKQKTPYALLITAVIVILSYSCNDEQKKSKPVETIDTASVSYNPPPQKSLDKNVLMGDWLRTDGEYRIQISELNEDGKMKASYFNPNSINVSHAQWKNEGGFLKIYIELRDQNYPGSNYNLVYMPDRNILSGEYYQAVERNKYKVEFTRTK